jgi:hypothetical protein
MVPSLPSWFMYMAFFGMAVIALLVIVGIPISIWWMYNHLQIIIH